ncbi:type IV conjugative transfer system pilin TraA [Vibrio sp. Vb339]|uniref:type IV conjugative transfer system pilin TraA n=1 Tax=Vibrio sp. Vb339 TaxID=1192013 RepID=UPI001552C27C|nr:type IV conjugative transfer system pilin TraA [Vibrio sp. Vb339]
MTTRTLTLALGLAVSTLLVTHPALAADIFAGGKQAMKDSAGKGSAVETAMLGTGLVGAVVSGLMTRNWFAAVGGFIGGSILWNIGAPLVGLG